MRRQRVRGLATETQRAQRIRATSTVVRLAGEANGFTGSCPVHAQESIESELSSMWLAAFASKWRSDSLAFIGHTLDLTE